MKSINIISLTQANVALTRTEYDNFINYYGIDISDDEVSDLTVLSANIVCVFRTTPTVQIWAQLHLSHQ